MMKLGAASGLWHFWIYGVEPKEQKSNFNFEIRMCELSGISFVDGNDNNDLALHQKPSDDFLRQD